MNFREFPGSKEELSFDSIAFIERVVRYQDGNLSRDEIVEFEEELGANRSKQLLFVELQINSASIRQSQERVAFEKPVVKAREGTIDRRYRHLEWMAVCVLVASIFAFAFFAVSRFEMHHSEDLSIEKLPRLTSNLDVRFIGVSQAQFLGELVPKINSLVELNRDYSLTNGLVELGFKSGATTIIEGPALFRVKSADGLSIDLGRCSVHAPKGAEGFQIETPTNRIVDRGTRFSVNVAETSEMEVHVVEGIAEVYPGIQDSKELKSSDGATQTSSRLRESEARRFVSTDTCSIETIEFTGGQYRPVLPDRIVSYEATEGLGGDAQDLVSLTLQRNGQPITYRTEQLIPARLTYFKAEAPNSIGHLISPNELPDSRAQLLSDSSLNTGIINPGGQAISLTASPVLNVDEANELGTPGFAIQFAKPVSNRQGPDVVFFDIQTLSNPIEGDAFHVSPLHFRGGLKSKTIGVYDVQFNSPTALKVDRFAIFRFADSISSISRLESAHCTRTLMRLGFRALAVGIDLSDLGYEANESVEGLFFQDAHDENDCAVDPVFIAGLPE
jgi:FecR protein